MKLLLLVPLLFSPPAPAAAASDPAAVYGIVDKVVMLPSDAQAESAEIWGRFCVADGGRGSRYRCAQAGYFHVDASKEAEAAVAQWRELARLSAGTSIVAFGSRRAMGEIRVAAPGQPRPAPVPYVNGWQMRKLENVDYGPARELRLLPRPLSPNAESAPKVPKTGAHLQTVALTCENCLERDPELRYLFTVAMSDGQRFSSGLVAPGSDSRTQWSAELLLKAGEEVTWTVQVLPAQAERIPVASASFVVGVQEQES